MADCDANVQECAVTRHDVVIPIVYPDQAITIPKGTVRQRLTALRLADDIDIDQTFRSTFDDPSSQPALRIVTDTKQFVKVSGLGHAGIAIIDGNSGKAEYYEYGRYDADGFGQIRQSFLQTRLTFDYAGNPKAEQLDALFRELTTTNGGPHRFEGVYVKLPSGSFEIMKTFASRRSDDVLHRTAPAYSVSDNHCFTFALEVAKAAGVRPVVSGAAPLTLRPVFTPDANFLERGISRGALSLFNIQVPTRQMLIMQNHYTPIHVSKTGRMVPFAFPRNEFE